MAPSYSPRIDPSATSRFIWQNISARKSELNISSTVVFSFNGRDCSFDDWYLDSISARQLDSKHGLKGRERLYLQLHLLRYLQGRDTPDHRQCLARITQSKLSIQARRLWSRPQRHTSPSWSIGTRALDSPLTAQGWCSDSSCFFQLGYFNLTVLGRYVESEVALGIDHLIALPSCF